MRCNQHVAGRGAHYLAQGVGFDLPAYGAGMGIEGAGAYHDGFRKPQALRPFPAQDADRSIRRDGLAVQACPQTGQERVQPDEKIFGGQSAEIRMPHRFVPGGAAAPAQAQRIGVAAEQGGYPVAVLYPGKGGPVNRLVPAQHVQYFGPEPF